MAEQDIDDKKNKKKSILDLDGPASPFPTDEQLQATKAERRGWIQKLREKGLPDMVANGAEYVSDSLTPDTQEDYITQLGAGVGSVGKPAVGILAGASKPAANAVAKKAISQEGQTALRRLARQAPSAKSAFIEGSEEALGGMIDDLAAQGTYVKPGQLNRAAEINKIKLKNEVRSNPTALEAPLDYKQINNASSKPAAAETIDYKKIGPGEVNPAVKDLQLDLQVANDRGDYKKAKEILARIREMRGGN